MTFSWFLPNLFLKLVQTKPGVLGWLGAWLGLSLVLGLGLGFYILFNLFYVL